MGHNAGSTPRPGRQSDVPTVVRTGFGWLIARATRLPDGRVPSLRLGAYGVWRADSPRYPAPGRQSAVPTAVHTGVWRADSPRYSLNFALKNRPQHQPKAVKGNCFSTITDLFYSIISKMQAFSEQILNIWRFSTIFCCIGLAILCNLHIHKCRPVGGSDGIWRILRVLQVYLLPVQCFGERRRTPLGAGSVIILPP